MVLLKIKLVRFLLFAGLYKIKVVYFLKIVVGLLISSDFSDRVDTFEGVGGRFRSCLIWLFYQDQTLFIEIGFLIVEVFSLSLKHFLPKSR